VHVELVVKMIDQLAKVECHQRLYT